MLCFRVFGCYEVLDGGELAEALEDFTGGVSEPVSIVDGNYASDQESRDELFKTMKEAADNEALMAAAIPVSICIVLYNSCSCMKDLASLWCNSRVLYYGCRVLCDSMPTLFECVIIINPRGDLL